MQRLLRNNGLSLLLFVVFAAMLVGQSATGYWQHNEDQVEHGRPELTYGTYLTSSHFLEVTMENWESEFLQMLVFVVLTVFLFQKGSSESKDPDKVEAVDRDPRSLSHRKSTPWPVRKGGLTLLLYENSLSIAFFLLFVGAFILHAAGGAGEYNMEQAEHGQLERVSTLAYIGTSRFWFESLQNWQSEFLAIFAMVVLSIWLRQRGSPESKPVDAPHDDTGSS